MQLSRITVSDFQYLDLPEEGTPAKLKTRVQFSSAYLSTKIGILMCYHRVL